MVTFQEKINTFFSNFKTHILIPFLHSKYAYFLGLILVSLLCFLMEDFLNSVVNFEFLSFLLGGIIVCVSLIKTNGVILSADIACLVTLAFGSYFFEGQVVSKDAVWEIFYPIVGFLFPFHFRANSDLLDESNTLTIIKNTFMPFLLELFLVGFFLIIWPMLVSPQEMKIYQDTLSTLLTCSVWTIPLPLLVSFGGIFIYLTIKELMDENTNILGLITALILSFFAFMRASDGFSVFFFFTFVALFSTFSARLE